MKEFELIQKLKNGDPTAFEKWMGIYAGNIERFAIQYGSTPDQAGKITEASFRTLHSKLKDLGSDEEPIYTLYKIAFEKLNNVHLVSRPTRKIFKFEEDQQLYENVILLDENTKAAFILSQFHEMNITEISTILDLSEDAVQEAISKGYGELARSNSQLEKQLAFLGKSFDRLVMLFNKEKVFENQQVEEKEIVVRKPALSKRIIMTWVAGIVILIALIAVPIVTGEEFRNSSDEKYVEKLKSLFEKEIAKKFDELGLTEENAWEEEYYYTDSFVKAARKDFEMMMRNIDRQLSRETKIDKKNLKKRYDEIVDKLQLPSEMAQQLFNKPLTNDQGKSEAFINEYIEKVLLLQHYYMMTYLNHEQILEVTTNDGEIDLEKFQDKNYIYPEDLQLMLDGMEKQNFQLTTIPNMVPFFPEFKINEFSERIRNSLHEDVLGYMAVLEAQARFYHTDQAYSIEETVDQIIEMEKTLLANNNEHDIYYELQNAYANLLYNNVVGSERNQFVGADGRIEEEYQKAWKKIASNDENSPSAYIMKSIVDEMENSDWTKSDSQLLLDFEHFYQALNLAKEGNLTAFTFEIDHEETNIYADADDIEYGFLSAPLDGPTFQSEVEKIYEEFSNDPNLALLRGVSPLLVIGLYVHANDMEDPETIWQLLNHEHILVSHEDYINNWMKQDGLLEEAENLVVEMGDASINGARHVPISYEKDGQQFKFSSLLFDNEVGIWTIMEVPLE